MVFKSGTSFGGSTVKEESDSGSGYSITSTTSDFANKAASVIKEKTYASNDTSGSGNVGGNTASDVMGNLTSDMSDGKLNETKNAIKNTMKFTGSMPPAPDKPSSGVDSTITKSGIIPDNELVSKVKNEIGGIPGIVAYIILGIIAAIVLGIAGVKN